jgi:hypothetical protein
LIDIPGTASRFIPLKQPGAYPITTGIRQLAQALTEPAGSSERGGQSWGAAQVVTAGNAAQALEILKGDQPVDLLLSDVEARRIRPELKVLLTSGYTAAALSLEHGLPDNLNVVEKPYRREELAKKLRLVIGG